MAYADRSAKVLGRVLVADDEEMVRGTLRLLLKSQGYQVEEAVDGEEAVRKYLEAPDAYDVILLDLDMPRLSGPEALKKIRRHHHQAKAIFLSGGWTPPDAKEVYLQKPFANDELLRLVGQMADHA